MDLSRKSQTSTNTSEFDPVEVRNLSRSRHESMSKVQGRESWIFQTYATFAVDFPNTYDDYTLFFFYKNIFYKNIEAEICKILRLF